MTFEEAVAALGQEPAAVPNGKVLRLVGPAGEESL